MCVCVCVCTYIHDVQVNIGVESRLHFEVCVRMCTRSMRSGV